MKAWRAVNMNDAVRYKLNPKGLEILRRHHDEVNERFGGKLGEFVPPEVDADGWSETQLWCLFERFGPHIGMGADQPIHTELMVFAREAP